MNKPDDTISGLVSVVICAWNNWPELEMTIESALHQSYQPLEVIVVDNSSTDATAEEVPRSFGNSVRYIRQPNRGDAGAYNTGFAVARGEFIQFVDGDDVLAPNKIAKQVKLFRANPDLGIVYGDIRRFQTLAGIGNWRDPAAQEEEDMLYAILVPEKYQAGLGALGALFHRNAIERVGPWDESLYVSDLDYWIRAAWAGCRFGYCEGSPMGFYRIRPGQMSANRAAVVHGLLAVWEKALGYVSREPYRTLIARLVAEHKFQLAISSNRTATRDALTMLSLARAANRDRISAVVYAAGCATIIVPGGRMLANSAWLRPIRHVLGRLLTLSKK